LKFVTFPIQKLFIMLYKEVIYFQNRSTQIIKWCFASCAIVQAIGLAAGEAGLAQLPLPHSVHGGLLLLFLTLVILFVQTSLILQFDTEGVLIQYFPHLWKHRFIRWESIRQVGLVPADQKSEHSRLEASKKVVGSTYWLAHARCHTICIHLADKTEIYFSTQLPTELIDFLQHGLHPYRIKISRG
jgi:hypothetical protein